MSQINKKEISKLILNSTGFKRQARIEALKSLEDNKQKMINEFTNHPVTQEISSGPTAQNSSGLLGGKGNLFSFIGFVASENPIAPVIKVLQEKTKLTGKTNLVIKNNNDSKIEYEVSLPTEAEIAEASKLPFESGRSWVWGIQQGISGFGNYLRHKMLHFSRSGTGAQTKNTLRSGSFKTSSYLSQIFTNFINGLK